ncbi:MAG: hypothetical protein GX260_05855 [Tissierellia bacterium]|nr:saccharopine dehydrogenase C-terminal domain-containing protein [Bacillota bacterium]NLL23290.1 hypothetical protein [Tissierellia bacterium]
MKYLIFGAGLQGRIVGYDILNFEKDAEVIYADVLQDNLKTAREIVGEDRVRFENVDINDEEASVALMKESDVVIICLPHDLPTTTKVYNCLAQAEGKKVVFSDYWLWDKHHEFHDALAEADVLAVPGLGIAPGFANICVGQLEHEFDELEEAIIYVGGLPVERGVCPLDYMELFNLEAMLDMYITPSTVYEDGEVTQKPILTVFDKLIIPGHGETEVFWTDGLCSLEKTMAGKGIKKLAETTLRWPGHIEQMKFLYDLGYLSTEPIDVNGVQVTPKDVSEKIFQKLWEKKPGVRDMTYLKVVGKGKKDGVFCEKYYELKGYSDEEKGITSMESTTAYPISIAALILAKDDTGLRGVISPELYFIGDKFDEMVEALGKRELNVYSG